MTCSGVEAAGWVRRLKRVVVPFREEWREAAEMAAKEDKEAPCCRFPPQNSWNWSGVQDERRWRGVPSEMALIRPSNDFPIIASRWRLKRKQHHRAAAGGGRR